MTIPSAPAAADRALNASRRAARPAQGLRGLKPAELLVGAVLVGIFAYELTFNLLPSSIRLPIAGGLAVGIILLSVAWIFASPRIWRVILFALLLVVVACWLMGEATGYGELDFAKGLRFLLPLFFALWVIEMRHSLNMRLVFFLAAGTLVIAMLSSIIRPQEVVSNLLRLPPFTGGEDGTHASSYVTALCTLLIHQLYLNNAISKRMAWSFLGLAAFLLIGMRVATPIFMLLNYGLLHTLLTRKLRGGVKVLLWFGMISSIVFVLIWHEALQEQVRGGAADSVENLGSGRIGTWLGRLAILSERDVPTLLFGSGPGSDSFVSEIWWWEKKDSHHDILTTVIESGIVGLLALFGFLFLLFRRLGREGTPLVWFLLSGSLVSNALMQRPIIATLFWLAVALAVLRIDEQLRIHWRQQQIRRRHLSQQLRVVEGAPAGRQRTGPKPGRR
ncbi:MAG: hypothetical protein HOC72_03790 [Rhodospirillaceae bacterium]|jgi:hypothetical protein|nr:hypothetical protein [Rhodospirillaceae bacterium]